MKVTQSSIERYLKSQLKTNKAWALRALIRIYANQTSDEQAQEDTKYINYVGFTGADAEILSSFAKQFQSRNFLSEKQMSILFHKIPKYWKQIWDMSDQQVIITKIETLETI